MSKTTKIYIIFLLIFLVGFAGIYLYIKLFLNQQLTTTSQELKEPVGALLGFL
ncbi:hypothetical protein [Psychroflexus tropicus]|uniref:hypothetical protein n=1 Tax=Psychroflexus tropicus TaxID=197345 RepID=UPI00036AFDCE|nr:hypothetical protein [Psychroflexus tropicus]